MSPELRLCLITAFIVILTAAMIAWFEIAAGLPGID